MTMEFHEKLQQLRKTQGITQEELAQALYVSRTAISKWESGRGYPNIDSLKSIARFYGVTIDDLLSGEEALNIAEDEHRQKEQHSRNLVFGLLDMSSVLFFFLPLFGQRLGESVQAVSLLTLSEAPSYLMISYFAVVIAMTAWGILLLALQTYSGLIWQRCKTIISCLLHGLAVFLFVLSKQPYAACLLLLFLAIKVLMLVKKR